MRMEDSPADLMMDHEAFLLVMVVVDRSGWDWWR
jgi:hypothetical protein